MLCVESLLSGATGVELKPCVCVCVALALFPPPQRCVVTQASLEGTQLLAPASGRRTSCARSKLDPAQLRVVAQRHRDVPGVPQAYRQMRRRSLARVRFPSWDSHPPYLVSVGGPFGSNIYQRFRGLSIRPGHRMERSVATRFSSPSLAPLVFFALDRPYLCHFRCFCSQGPSGVCPSPGPSPALSIAL